MKKRLVVSALLGIGFGVVLLWSLSGQRAQARVSANDAQEQSWLLNSTVSFTPDQVGTAQPGHQKLYFHTLSHDSATTITYRLQGVSSRGWDVSLAVSPTHGSALLPMTDTNPLSITLGPSASVSVVVAITVPTGATYQAHDKTVVTATSVLSPDVYASVADHTDVGLDLAPPLLSPNHNSGSRPGGLLTEKQNLYNGSNADDLFLLEANSAHSWTVALSNDPLISPYDTADVHVFVLVPETASLGTVDHVVVTATSTLSPVMQATAILTITVRPAVSVTIGPPLHKVGAPNTTVTFTHVVTNHGAVAAFFVIEASSAHGWETKLRPEFWLMGDGETSTVRIHLSVPSDAYDGLIDETVVTATAYSPVDVVSDVLIDTVTIQEYSIYLPLLLRGQ